mgnify:CR=1 FL=1
MNHIDQLILASPNPFDQNCIAVNFWLEQQQSALMVDSIHGEAIATISETLEELSAHNTPKSLLIGGDSGSGKTYLLGRLKKQLNPKAYFAYIIPCQQVDYLWRHILRETVNSLVQVPEGEQHSQLLLWLQSLVRTEKTSSLDKLTRVPIWDLLKSDRERGKFEFIQKLNQWFGKSGIFNQAEFFQVLFELTNPALQEIAIAWLRGDSLSEEQLKQLEVKACIQEESTAQNILANFGKISAQTKPIVLCFDQLESADIDPSRPSVVQALFKINTIIHSSFKNFLIIINILRDQLRQVQPLITTSERNRISKVISLKPINLDQAIALWQVRLSELHAQADPKPDSAIYPLSREQLEQQVPSKLILPRAALKVGKDLYQAYKLELIEANKIAIPTVKPESQTLDYFGIAWQEQLSRSRNLEQISNLMRLEMLFTGLEALGYQTSLRLISSPTFKEFSFSFAPSHGKTKIGVVWTEHQNQTSLYHIMKACTKISIPLYLVRAAALGKPKSQGTKLYHQIFKPDSANRHLIPDLASLKILAAFHQLATSAKSGDLEIGGEPIDLAKLQHLAKQAQVLQSCQLIAQLTDQFTGQHAGQHTSSFDPKPAIALDQKLEKVYTYALHILKTQMVLAVPKLFQNLQTQFPDLSQLEIEKVLNQLCEKGEVVIMNPQEPQIRQLIMIKPTNS